MSKSKHALARKLYTDEPIAAHKAVRFRKRKKGWLGLALVGMSSLSLVTLMVVVYLGFCTQIVEKQYAFDHYESLLPALREENSSLELQVRALSNPSRIERLARADLHMDVPKERIMIIQDDNEESTPKYAWKGNLQKIGWP